MTIWPRLCCNIYLFQLHLALWLNYSYIHKKSEKKEMQYLSHHFPLIKFSLRRQNFFYWNCHEWPSIMQFGNHHHHHQHCPYERQVSIYAGRPTAHRTNLMPLIGLLLPTKWDPINWVRKWRSTTFIAARLNVPGVKWFGPCPCGNTLLHIAIVSIVKGRNRQDTFVLLTELPHLVHRRKCAPAQVPTLRTFWCHLSI